MWEDLKEGLEVTIQGTLNEIELNRRIAENHQRFAEEVIGNLAALRALEPDELTKAVLGNVK